jgi:hypothetical protein
MIQESASTDWSLLFINTFIYNQLVSDYNTDNLSLEWDFKSVASAGFATRARGLL